ncbi:MAG TPA: molybdate ABC transporter substrate-binding protein [Anaerolineae bacterium]|nr:molybdate ABC transporter substrate-binding protein [Anaerolineae bacterium]
MHPRNLIKLALTLSLALLATSCQDSAATRPTTLPTLTVSAAADLVYAFGELGRAFEQQTGVAVVFNFGSTGQLAQQIEQGAPVDLFAAANVSFVEELAQQGRVLPDTVALYGRGRITLWTRADSPLRVETIKDLAQPAVRRIAIASPDHAPYGVAAREALQSAGLWDALQPKLILGENVRQTLQYAQTGDVDVAIVALSLSLEEEGRWVLVPQELHTPIDQALAVVTGSRNESAARAFAALVNSPDGRAIMRRYGFVLPDEEAAP